MHPISIYVKPASAPRLFAGQEAVSFSQIRFHGLSHRITDCGFHLFRVKSGLGVVRDVG